MVIEISLGAGGAASVNNFQLNYDSFISNTESIISGFKTIKRDTYNLNGDVGNLQSALDDIETRICREEEKKTEAINIQRKTNDFLNLAIRVDSQVADLVAQHNEEFYKTNPWAKPTTLLDDTNKWLGNAWEWICGVGDKIEDGIETAWQWTKDTVSKAWNGLVDFYNEHKKAMATIFMVAGAITALIILCVIPGGGILAAIISGAAWGIISGSIIGGISGGINNVINGDNFWVGLENGAFDGAIGGAIVGASFAGLGAAGQLLGSKISCMSTIGKSIKVISKISKAVSIGMDSFDMIAIADLIVNKNNNTIYDFNSKLHSSATYNFVQVGANALATFTGAVNQTMACFVAGTLILTTNGLVPIEKIHIGDYVLSTDVRTWKTTHKKVSETFKKNCSRIIRIYTGDDEIITTPDHPFYVNDFGFVHAENLDIADELVDNFNKIHKIKEIIKENLLEPTVVYNFTVENFHTYYVGNKSILVHNANCRLIQNPDGSYDVELSYKDNWTQEQRMEADIKCMYLTEADTVKVDVSGKRDITKTSKFRKLFSVSSDLDIDHIVDLQLSGDDVSNNFWMLDKSVNRSLGRQIASLIDTLPESTKLRNFYMK